MNPPEKRDAREIRAHLNALKKSPWLGPARSWWPDYLFHFTDIRNAVSILKTGWLLSRQQLQASGQTFTNSASPTVIDQTEEHWKDYVRLYFRPRTPTQYRNEGLRPVSGLQLGGAHCPLPIYLLFDSKSLLSRRDALFCEGNLAAGAQPEGHAERFKLIPFERVYHDTWLDPNETRTIVFHRNAEVIVPTRLDLSALRLVWCRSQAEYQTLVHLLPPGTRRRWAGIIGSGTKLNLFFRYWTFVEKVDLSKTEIAFHFNQGTKAPGPFQARVEIEEMWTSTRYAWKDDAYLANDVLLLRLPDVSSLADYSVRLFLDDHLAYAGSYQEEILPF